MMAAIAFSPAVVVIIVIIVVTIVVIFVLTGCVFCVFPCKLELYLELAILLGILGFQVYLKFIEIIKQDHRFGIFVFLEIILVEK